MSDASSNLESHQDQQCLAFDRGEGRSCEITWRLREPIVIDTSTALFFRSIGGASVGLTPHACL